jgi:hypothetical protein
MLSQRKTNHTGFTADVKEDGIRIHSTQQPNSAPIEHLCASSVNLEKGIWKDTALQAQKFFKDVGFPK